MNYFNIIIFFLPENNYIFDFRSISICLLFNLIFMKNTTTLLITTLLISINLFAQVNHPFQIFTLNGSNGFTLEGSQIEDLSGAAVSAAGDINGDGFDDILVGAYLADDAGKVDAGKVYVVFGQAEAFDPFLQLSNLNGNNGFIINGKESHHQLGWAVSSAGDFNNDGFDDILISAPSIEINGETNVGESYLIFGKATAYTATFDLTSLNGTNGFALQGENEFDFFGYDIDGIGDLNNDNFDDIIISAPFASPNQIQHAGSSYVIFGNNSNASGLLQVSSLNGNNGFRIDGRSTNDFSGFSLSGAGDFNNDNFNDILIGAYAADALGNVEAGESYLIYGHGGVYSSSVELGSLNGGTGFIINGIDSGDFSGREVSNAGDINNDNFDDILIGAPTALSNTNEQAGETYVLFGNNSNSSSFDLITLNGTNGFILKGIAAQDYSGSALSSLGDVNSDGIDDILIGARDASPNGFASGAAYVYFGKTTGFTTTVNLNSLDGTNGLSIFGKNPENQLGAALSGLGDINGDNVNDFIIGAKGASANVVASGESYIITDIFGCLATAGFISTATPISNFSICEGTDLLDETQASAAFVPYYGDLNGFDPSTGFEYAMLLVDENNTIIETALTSPYDFDFSSLSAGTYSIYGFAFKEIPNVLTINDYLSNIQSDSDLDDLLQIIADDNDATSGGTGDGNYCLDLKNLDSNGAAVQIVIEASPTVTTADIDICIGEPLTLMANSPDIGLVYEWTSTNFLSTEQNPTVSNAAVETDADIYTVMVSSDANGCTTTASSTVSVHSLPSVSTLSDISVCLGETINLLASSSETVDYDWAKPPSYSSTQQNPSISNSTFDDGGTYTVTVSDQNGCTATENTLVTVNDLPTVSTSDITVDEGETIQLMASFVPDVTYQWYGPNNFFSTLQNPILSTNASLDNAGNYQVEITDINTSCTASAIATVTVESLIIDCSTSGLSVTAADIDVIEGEGVQLSASFIAGVTYQWFGPNGFSSTEQNPFISNNATTNVTGNYTVTVTDENGCTASAIAQVNVQSFVFNCADSELEVAAADFNVQVGETIQLTATSPTALTYQWYGPNGFTSNQQNPILSNSATVGDAGNYTVIVMDENNCTETDIAIIMVIPDDNCLIDIVISDNPPNNTVITVQNTITTSGEVIVGNNSNVIFQAGQSITLAPEFSVELGSTFLATIEGCSGGSFTDGGESLNSFSNKQFSLIESENTTNTSLLQVIPNPFKNNAQITYHLMEDGMVDLTLYSSQGKKIKNLVQSPLMLAGQYTIDVQNEFLKEGLYFLVLKTKNGAQTQKLMVLK